MDKFYPPYFPCYIPLPNGKPAAGGKLYAYFTGTNNLAPLYAEDGTILVGSVADIDSSGQVHVLLDPAITYRLKVVPPASSQMPDQIYDNVRVANGTIVGMENPMTDQGDMIVGGATGIPVRLAHPNRIGFLRATLSFGMKVLQWVGLTGTNGIEVTNGNSGTEIGLDTTGASEGDALKIVSGVPTWTTDQTGMANPMTTKGDLIVGATGGEPDRLGVGADGDILASALYGGDLTPTWEAGPKKYRNVYGDIPSPQIDDGYLGCLFYLSTAGQTLNLPAAATIPAKSFIDFVCLADAATLAITPQGTTTLNGQGSAVTIGGKSASFYRLVFLGHGGSGDEWAVGGTDTATQPGDHKAAVDGSDTSPDYLAAKLSAGTGITLTNTGSAVQIAATAQTGDHQLLVSATDAAAGYLGAKLTAGSNVTLTTQTDGDGVQSIEIAAAGGGGGAAEYSWAVSPVQSQFNPECNGYCYGFFVGGAQLPSTVKSFTIFARQNPYAHANFTTWVAIYDWTDTANNRPLKSSFTWDASKHPSTDWSNFAATFNYDSPVTIDRTHMYEIVWHYHSGDSPFQFFGTNYFTNVSTIWGRLSWSETANYGATPKASFNDYSSWTSLYQAPYVQLNSWSV